MFGSVTNTSAFLSVLSWDFEDLPSHLFSLQWVLNYFPRCLFYSSSETSLTSFFLFLVDVVSNRYQLQSRVHGRNTWLLNFITSFFNGLTSEVSDDLLRRVIGSDLYQDMDLLELFRNLRHCPTVTYLKIGHDYFLLPTFLCHSMLWFQCRWKSIVNRRSWRKFRNYSCTLILLFYDDA